MRATCFLATLIATGLQGCRPAAVAVREELFLPEEEVAIEVLYEHPVTLPRIVSVVLPGGFSPDHIPASSANLLREDAGIVQVYLDLPGGDGQPSTPGQMDHYGEKSRQAVAAALRYAAGEISDDAGLTLLERVEITSNPPLVLVGRSNGGNLATATLADPNLDLPQVDGLVVWETPAGPQFLLTELSQEELGLCRTHTDQRAGLVCEMNLEQLVDGTPPFLDRNENGQHDTSEPSYNGLELGETRLHSPTLLQALPPSPSRMDIADALEWFAWRDASQRAAETHERHPELAVILLGSEEDHAQTIRNSPHVIGLGEIFETAGAWTRLLPDIAYSELSVEQPEGVGLSLNNPGVLAPSPTWLTGLISAGVLELGDRALNNAWQSDLQQPLRESP
ncbi:MAG: hypothetical protein VX519_08345 [Myxococcota bacterium]|nr:hypothetical protein [Myxococcota bacterium]